MSVRARRRARKLAFQGLFMLDARNHWDFELVREFFGRTEPPPTEEALSYALRLVETVLAHRVDELDPWIDQVHPRWRLKRMLTEDRTALRLGLAELWYHEDVPPKVSVNEWVEVAKVFGGDESPRFVNGILDRALRERHASHASDRPTPATG